MIHTKSDSRPNKDFMLHTQPDAKPHTPGILDYFSTATYFNFKL